MKGDLKKKLDEMERRHAAERERLAADTAASAAEWREGQQELTGSIEAVQGQVEMVREAVQDLDERVGVLEESVAELRGSVGRLAGGVEGLGGAFVGMAGVVERQGMRFGAWFEGADVRLAVQERELAELSATLREHHERSEGDLEDLRGWVQGHEERIARLEQGRDPAA